MVSIYFHTEAIIILEAINNDESSGGNIMKKLVTGGAGYIGGHTCVELLNEGHMEEKFDEMKNIVKKYS